MESESSLNMRREMKKAIFLIFIVSVSIIPEIKMQNNGYFFPILR